MSIMDWKGVLRAILRPREYVKRRCLIDGKPMEKGDDGIYRCANGHTFNPNYKGPGTDPMIQASKGDTHGDL